MIHLNGIDESYPNDLPVSDTPVFLANKKVDAYLPRLIGNEMIITADTLVISGERVLGKPRSFDEAFEMLKLLSGEIHKVVTGVCIHTRHKRKSIKAETEVKFANLEDKEIEFYINTFKPYDKAGSYGIQEWIGCIAVEWIKGSYYNVMGLPIHLLYKALKEF